MLMDKQELISLLKKIKVRYANFTLPTESAALREMVSEWLEDLQHTPYDTALNNLRTYSADPVNKFAPHPGVLAQRKENDAYFEAMRELAENQHASIEQMKLSAVKISDEQRRKVSEIFGRATITSQH